MFGFLAVSLVLIRLVEILESRNYKRVMEHTFLSASFKLAPLSKHGLKYKKYIPPATNWWQFSM